MSNLIHKNTRVTCQGFGIRLLAMLILAVVSISAASAEGWRTELVGLFREICIVPDSPAAMMAAGEKFASERNWVFEQQKSERVALMHHPLIRFPPGMTPDPSEKPPFIVKIWTFSLPPAVDIGVVIALAAPEYTGIRYNRCGFVMPGSAVEETALEVQRLLGSSVVPPPRDRHIPGVSRSWLISEAGKPVAGCRKGIGVSSYHPKTYTYLVFFELLSHDISC
jgi:hypothetical protein